MGFKTNGEVSAPANAGANVVFCLKSSSGKELKSYSVASDKADSFADMLQKEEPKLREEAGETDPLRLVRMSKVS